MSTSFIFNNKKIQIPGAYSQIKSGIKNPALDLEFGNALVIDTGSGKFFGGGAGINGELANGKDAIHAFDNVSDFRNHVKGGLWYVLGAPLFFPGGGATSGVSSLTYVRAMTTIAAIAKYTWTGGGGNGGVFGIKIKDEGFIGNGIQGDETRATSVITVSNAGSENDVISITVPTLNSVANLTVATYIVGNSDTIADVVAGLVASANEIGICPVSASTSTTLTIQAPEGYGVYTATPTSNETGAVASTPAAFSGGADGTQLTKGYAMRMKAGEIDTANFIVEFYRGSYRGKDGGFANVNNDIETTILDAVPELITESAEFSTVTELIEWANEDGVFNEYFELTSDTAAAGDGSVDATDLSNSAGNTTAADGYETTATTDLDAALDALKDLRYDFILADNWGDDARSANNIAIQGWIATEAVTKPDLYIGGGKDSSKFTAASVGSIPVAIAYNDQNVTVVHGGVKKSDVALATGFRAYDSIYKAAAVLGREAGQEPQVPLSFKAIGIEGELHPLKDKEVVQALNAGVLTTRLDSNTFDVIKGINTLQKNNFLVNSDGSTHVKSLNRIVRQLNKELEVNGREALLKKPNGTNRNTLSAEDVKSFVEGYLASKVATSQDDNLILSFGNITVTTNQDAYNITYEVVPNFEVNFLFFTGFLLDPSTN